MPRRRRSSKRRTLSPEERFRLAFDEGLPPNPVVRHEGDSWGRLPHEVPVPPQDSDADGGDGKEGDE